MSISLWKKFLQFEKRMFSAPYKWLLKKGIIAIGTIAKRIYLSMDDLYEDKFLDEYKGNPNWAGDD